MRYCFNTKHVISYTIDDTLVVNTDPDNPPSRHELLAIALRAAKISPINTLSEKAAAALVMTHSIDEAAAWLEECEEVHTPGDCPLCGAV